jgi:hypothetical protein
MDCTGGAMDWFGKLTGFQEGAYNETRDKLDVREGRLFPG